MFYFYILYLKLIVKICKFVRRLYSDFGYEILVHIKADKGAEFTQLNIKTQEANIRPFFCIYNIFLSVERYQSIFKNNSSENFDGH